MTCENTPSQSFNTGFNNLYYNAPKRHSEDFDGTVWTCPKDGFYKIRASFSVTAKVSRGDLRIAMFKNSQQSTGFNDSFKNVSNPSLYLEVMEKCSAGDTIQIKAWSASGGLSSYRGNGDGINFFQVIEYPEGESTKKQPFSYKEDIITLNSSNQSIYNNGIEFITNDVYLHLVKVGNIVTAHIENGPRVVDNNIIQSVTWGEVIPEEYRPLSNIYITTHFNYSTASQMVFLVTPLGNVTIGVFKVVDPYFHEWSDLRTHSLTWSLGFRSL